MPNASTSAHLVTARSQKTAAKIFNYGTILAMLIPFPLLILWAGASMFVYAMNRHHPNPKVGHYTQRAATRFYAIAGSLVAIATFFPVEIIYYAISWGIGLAILIPLSVLDIKKVNRDQWDDMTVDLSR